MYHNRSVSCRHHKTTESPTYSASKAKSTQNLEKLLKRVPHRRGGYSTATSHRTKIKNVLEKRCLGLWVPYYPIAKANISSAPRILERSRVAFISFGMNVWFHHFKNFLITRRTILSMQSTGSPSPAYRKTHLVYVHVIRIKSFPPRKTGQRGKR
jgi:hypothetical protein